MNNKPFLVFALILLLSSCSSVKFFRYLSKGKSPKGSFKTEIPFEYKNNLIVIKTKLNDSDQEFEFMLDSGAPSSILYQEALEASKAKVVMSFDVSDSQGNASKSNFYQLQFKIGNAVFSDIFAGYSQPNEVISCIAPGGIIGADLMQTANWEIDFEHKKIVISDLKSKLPSLVDYQKLSFSKRSPFGALPWLNILPGMTVNLDVNGQRYKDVYIDLGSSGTITLPKNEVSHKLFQNEQKEVMYGYSSFGLLGTEMDTTFYYGSTEMYIDKLKLNYHSIDISNNNQSLIGTGIFSEYAMIIDFRKNKLYLKPRDSVELKPAVRKDFGCYFLYNSETHISTLASLFEGSPADLAGLQLNDTIVEINDEKIPVFSDYCAFRQWTKEVYLKDSISIKIARREEVFHLEKAIIPKR